MRVHLSTRTVPVAVAALAFSSLSAVPALAAPELTGVSVAAAQSLVRTADGSAAKVTVTLTTGAATSGAVTVRYATGSGTATAGTDYTAASGTVTFPAGSTSGATRQFLVPTARTAAGETAETIPVSLTTDTAGVTVGANPTVVIDAHGLPYLNPRLPIAVRVRDLLSRMTLEEKVGQMTQAERGAFTEDPTLVATWKVGSVLSGGGSVPAENTPEGWADMVDAFQTQALSTRLQIPIIYGVDSVHGHGNLVGATIFPHNIGLGATRNPALVEQIAHVTAVETRATGPQWAFAPCVCVARDDRWGRAYESFGESPALVTAMTTAIDGLQGPRASQLSRPDRVLASTKHFAGDGDTEYGTGNGDFTIDQGVTVTSKPDFYRIDLAPYVAAVKQRKTGTIMPSYSSVDWTEDGVGNPLNMHEHKELLTDVLKGKLGFDGFLISDYEGVHHNAGDYTTQVRSGVNAGIDMFMEPYDYQTFETTLLGEVNGGRVAQSRVNDAVARILTKKFQLGVFEKPFTDRSNIASVGSPQHRALARKAAADSQVLLKNSGAALPLRGNEKIYVAGRNADNIGNQAGGWTVQWQGVSGDSIPGTTVLEGIKQVAPRAQVTYSADGSAPTAGSDVAVVVVGETPYAEGYGDVGAPSWPWGTPEQTEPKTMELNPADSATVDKVCAAIAKCVVLVVSGRPQILTASQLSKIDSLVASWLPGSEGAGVADVLFGKKPFTGRLSVSWPRSADQEPINVGDPNYRPLYPYGWGLTTGKAHGQVAALREQAQTRIAAGAAGVPANAAALFAAADEQVLAGRSDLAVSLLRKAGGLR